MIVNAQSILAATDFSPRAEHAVERAALLAQQDKAVLHLLSEAWWKAFCTALTATCWW